MVLTDEYSVSCVFTGMFLLTLIGLAFQFGISPSNLPAIGTSQTTVVGNVLFNFAMANEIPSWANVTHPRVSIHKSIWNAIIICCFFYVSVGILGMLYFFFFVKTIVDYEHVLKRSLQY